MVGGADAQYITNRPLGANTFAVTPLQLESMAGLPLLHGVNERIKVNEIGRSIAFYYQLLTNLEDL